jgi:anti-sigma factor (TIGR02949 family)
MSDTEDVGCEQALKHLVEFVDQELPDGEHDSVEQHLRICRNCCSRMEFERRLKERLSTLSTEEVPSTTRDRVRDLIKRF